ncbi:hypothetical protein VZ52_20925 [Ralstonia mannitolilytica]|nr:hypothetical protein VZ52_20925 [Ralstonia mannitolilytica]
MLAVALSSIGSGFVAQAVNAYSEAAATAVNPKTFQIFIVNTFLNVRHRSVDLSWLQSFPDFRRPGFHEFLEVSALSNLMPRRCQCRQAMKILAAIHAQHRKLQAIRCLRHLKLRCACE